MSIWLTSSPALFRIFNVSRLNRTGPAIGTGCAYSFPELIDEAALRLNEGVIMKKPAGVLLTAVAILFVASSVTAGTITNGVAVGTVGHFSLDLDAGSESVLGNTSKLTWSTSADQGTEEFVFGLYSYVDIGGLNAFQLGDTVGLSTNLATDPDVFTSTGTFTGSEGNIIDWIATSSIPSNSQKMISTFQFTARNHDDGSAGSLGTLNFTRYFDEDLLALDSNLLDPSGAAADGTLQLFVFDEDADIGVSQSGAYSGQWGLVNADFLGWAADDAGDLRDVVIYNEAKFSPTGVIGSGLTKVSHPRLSGRDVWRGDVSTALFYDVDATASSATIVTMLGGLPEGRRVTPAAVPLPTGAWMGFALLGTLGLVRRARRARYNQSI